MLAAKEIRENRAKRLSTETFDITIIGGGVQGAFIAREAALRGYKVALFEAKDFAFGTSSRSSKLLHGGVRYLEQGNFSLVMEALRERQYAIRCAPHLARPLMFHFPTISGLFTQGLTRPAWQVRIGLGLYDALAGTFTGGAKDLFPTSSFVSKSSDEWRDLEALGLKFNGLLSYSDGQMEDSRLVVEAIVDAEELGGVCINHAPVTSLKLINKTWDIGWTCELSGKEFASRSKLVINAGGPWVSKIHSLIGAWPSVWPTPTYSRGVHLLFDIPWNRPGLILPTGEKGRYYFVLPHFTSGGSHTLVGTTDRLNSDNEDNPVANEDEMKEIFDYLTRDLPNSGLNKDSYYQSFCGMRILGGAPASASDKDKNKKASEFSRSEAILEQDGYLLLLGGKWTTSRLIAENVIVKADKLLRGIDTKKEKSGSRTRPYPGGNGLTKERIKNLSINLAVALAERSNSSAEEYATLAGIIVKRFGSRAERFIQEMEPVANNISATRAEIRYAINVEQAGSVRDVIWRRLSLGHAPGGGADIKELVIEELINLTGQDRAKLEAEPTDRP